ncbi:MAG: hypothetical protein DRI57_24210 [Deltaproteobacteria bacterium]|nr:MAG: hypothetical protein DRI57_24210 [Deltaproteobacteria bacterium]
MSETSILTVQVPADLKHRITLVAEEQRVSVNQLAMVHKRDREFGGGSEDIGVLERLSPGGNTVRF